MPVPVEWLGNFQVNTGTAATGTQSDPKIIGLANGNILLAWTEAADGAIGTPAGSDIIGKIYDAAGNLVRDSYRLNGFANVDDERDFDIAATNDGGFVMVYLDDDISNANQTSVVWQRYDDGGFSIDALVVADESVAADFLANPKVAVDLINNLSFITYTDDVGTDTDIRGNTVTAAGVLGTEFDAAENSADPDRDADVAVLSNGNFVTAFEEFDADSGKVGIQFRVMTAAGASVINVEAAPDANQAAPKVASLVGGGFVVVWQIGDNVEFRVFSSAGGAVTGLITAEGTADLANEPDVIGLADGGFLIVWDNDTDFTVEARRFTALGAADGALTVPHAFDGLDPSLGLTSDGRILTAARQIGGEIFASIWDPRGATINAGDFTASDNNVLGTDVIHGGVGATTINGENIQGLTIRGQAGNDTITGGSNSQTLLGGGGADSILGGQSATPTSVAADSIDGGTGNDTIIAALGADALFGGSGNDSISGNDGADLIDGGLSADALAGGLGDDTIFASLSDASVSGDSISGNDGDDELTGNGGGDTIDGGAGNDTVRGGAGADLLAGGNDIDTVNYDDSSVAVNVVLNGATNSGGDAAGDTLSGFQVLIGSSLDDTLTGDNSSARTLDGSDGNDRINGGLGSQTLLGGLGNDSIFGSELATSAAGDSIAGGSGVDVLIGAGGGDLIDGGSDIDTLNGRKGDDTLIGGEGRDALKGNQGADQFRLTTIGDGGPDRILDFGLGPDVIALDGSVFGLAPGALDPAIFVLGNGALDANDRLIYKPGNGRLFFDPDGTGAGAQVQIATITNLSSLDAGDFIVI